MGFLERKARARLQKKLGPYLAPGEQILQFDYGTATAEAGALLGRVYVAATDRSVFFLTAAGHLRIGYCDIMIIHVDRSVLRIWSHGGPEEFGVDFGTYGVRGTGEVVKERLLGLKPYRRHFPVRADGKGFTISYHPWRPLAPSSWFVEEDSGITPDDETVVKELAIRRRQAADEILAAWEKPTRVEESTPRDIAEAALHSEGDWTSFKAGRADQLEEDGDGEELRGKPVVLACSERALYVLARPRWAVGPLPHYKFEWFELADWEVQRSPEQIVMRLLHLDRAATIYPTYVKSFEKALELPGNKLMILGWKADEDDAEIREAIIDGIASKGSFNPMRRAHNPLGRPRGAR